VLLVLLLSFFSASLESCLICAWPHDATVNHRGQCVISVTTQANLSAGCYIWCDAWARSSGVSQTATPMVSSADDANAGRCVCQRASSAGTVQYTYRTTSNCPVNEIGQSDEVINSWLQDDFYNSQNRSQDNNIGWSKSGESSPFQGAGDVSLSGGITGHVYMDDVIKDIDYRAQSVYGAVNLSFAPRFDHLDSAMFNLRDSVSTLAAGLRSIATADQLDHAVASLNYAINSHGGGGSPDVVDFSGVTNAINASTKSILDSLGKIAARKGSDSGTDSGTDSINLSGVNSRLDKLNKSTSGVSSSVDSFSGRFSEYAKNQGAYRSADSLNGKGWQDSVNKAISGGSGDGSWNGDSSSVFNSNSSQASTNEGAIESEMSALKTDLKSSSCTEFPPLTVHLPLFDVDLSLGDEFNRYPALLVVLRMMGRLVGGLAGFLLFLRSLQGKKGD